jgi:hypothetical protein
MFNDADLPKSSVERPDTGFDAGAQAPLAASPARFGRLALCVAAASALALGVVGTVAYGIWFNHDQQAYADAMKGARQALSTAASMPVTRAATAMSTGAQIKAGAPATAKTQSAAPDGEEGGKQASWSGPVTPRSTLTAQRTGVATTTPVVAASSVLTAHRTAPPSSPATQQSTFVRPARDVRVAQQDRRSSSMASARHKSSLFARMGSFFRRVNYRQHGTGSQQDIYSHP